MITQQKNYETMVSFLSDKFGYFVEEPTISYEQFIQSKEVEIKDVGFVANRKLIDPTTFGFQADSVVWSCKRGRCMVSAAFGLGKTRVQIEIAKQIIHRDGGKFLFVAPLGARHVFVEDGVSLGVDIQYVKSDDDIRNSTSDYLITNYERIQNGGVNPIMFPEIIGISLDEGNKLRNRDSQTTNVLYEQVENIKYRFVCTATPDPNRESEMNNYADWLGIADRSYILTHWFKRNPHKAGDLTLIPQHAESYWLWVATWALFIYLPSDIGYPDKGYELPEMEIIWHRLPTDHTRAFKHQDSKGQYRLLLMPNGSSTETACEKRETLDGRLGKLVEIVEGMPDRNLLIWHSLEDERVAIEKAIPEAVSVYGSQSLEEKERRILGFERGEFRILSTKPSIAGAGCNFQRYCHTAIYIGVDYMFDDFFQSIHRIYRFLQTKKVQIHIIYSASEDNIINTLKAKWEQYAHQKQEMRAIVARHGLTRTIKGKLRRTTGVKMVRRTEGELFEIINSDCVLEVKNIPDNSVDMILTSYPFGNHYAYTTSNNDFGHNYSDEMFFRQMDYLLPELLRVLKPGRLLVAHVKDRVLYSHMTKSTNGGFTEIGPFTSWNIFAHVKHRFIYSGRCTVVTDVVRENNSTYRLGHSEMKKDGTKMGFGLNEELQAFRKPPSDSMDQYADEPVAHSEDYSIGRWQLDASGYWRSDGNVLISPELYDYEAHATRLDRLEAVGNLPKTFLCEDPGVNSLADNLWLGINFMQGLNNEQSMRGIENHLCPLPFDIVRRCIERFSNPGDLILDPFCGLGTVPYIAVDFGFGDKRKARRAIGIELSPKYYEWASKYCSDKERGILAPTLFDYVESQFGIEVW